MKRVLALIGSPRNLGNCELMVKEISRQIPEEHELRLLRLSDFDLRPCRGCYACLFRDQGCVIDDDLSLVLDEILAADAYIAAAPAYFLGPSSVLKRLLDRALAFYAHGEQLWGRPAVALAVAGIRDREGYTQLGVESFLKLLLADLKDSRVIYGALPGEIFYGEENKAVAAELGAALFGARRHSTAPACPVCGGSTFRFLGGDRVRCMLCSNPGSVSLRDAEPHFEVGEGAHEMFTSMEAVVTHREWLKGMKERFLRERKQLKEITTGYLEGGTRVTP
ncbi:MAG: flavodoxin family protein [Deferrisomatales bacterium]|nr:flavodoxin family protein [Deferrisomatales bacterium]